MVGDVAQRDAPLDVAEGGGERVVARARGDRRAVGCRGCRDCRAAVGIMSGASVGVSGQGSVKKPSL